MGGSQSRRKRLSITQEGLDHSGRVLFTEIVSLCVALWKPHPVSPGLFCGERVSQPRLSSVKQPCSRNRGHSCLTPSSSNPHPADSVLGRHLSSRSPGVFGLKAGHPWTPWDNWSPHGAPWVNWSWRPVLRKKQRIWGVWAAGGPS